MIKPQLHVEHNLSEYITADARFTRVLAIPRSVLDLDKTFNCGQTFLWEKVDDSWYGFIFNSLVRLSQTEDEITVVGNVSELSFRYYFDLATKYTFTQLSAFEKKCVDIGRGIRILRQPLLECLITFIISQNNNMRRIRKSLIALCELYGSNVSLDGCTKYSFPDPTVLYSITLDQWRDLGVGYRAKYLYDVFHSDTFSQDDWIDFLLGAGDGNTVECVRTLMKLNGVGPKVASCVALFGYHHLDAFPIDTHIKKILNEHRDVTLPRPDGLDGVMQQYLFYYDAFHKEEST